MDREMGRPVNEPTRRAYRKISIAWPITVFSERPHPEDSVLRYRGFPLFWGIHDEMDMKTH
jgi:hypothetical protein